MALEAIYPLRQRGCGSIFATGYPQPLAISSRFFG
jgi:hypothetical protein